MKGYLRKIEEVTKHLRNQRESAKRKEREIPGYTDHMSNLYTAYMREAVRN